MNASAGTMTGTPANPTISGSGYTFALAVTNNQLVARVLSSDAGLATLQYKRRRA
jgi:hypothetical protein